MSVFLASALASPARAETDAAPEAAAEATVKPAETPPLQPESVAPPPQPVTVSTETPSIAPPPVSTSTAAPPTAAAQLPRPWVLGEIAVVGNKNVKHAVIRGQVKARKGDLYDRPELDRDVQAVLGLGSFERVKADISPTDKPVPPHLRKVAGSSTTVRLTLTVVEKPLVKKILFVGNKKLGKGLLLDTISLHAKDPLDTLRLKEDEEKILEKYREKGYLDAVVTSTVTPTAQPLQSEVTFSIVEGVRSKIFWVRIAGAKQIEGKKLLKLMKNKRKKVFVEKELKDDIQKIKAYYLNRGFLDVEVSSATVLFSHDQQRIYIDISVSEGRPYRHGDTTFSGHLIYSSTELAKALDYRKGKIFNQERFEESMRAIQELYAEKGRLRARVTPVKTFNSATGLMDVHFSIVEGDIVYVGYVDVEGFKNTKKHVFKRELVVKPGQMFQASKIRKSREKIMNLGFIDDVDLDIQPSQTDEDKVDLTFEVKEGKPGILTAGAAYSSIDGLIGTLSLQHLNLFGRAQRTSVQWSFGRRVQDYSISWTTPWVGDSPTSLGFDLFNTRRVNPFETSLSAYVERNTGGTVRVGPRFEEDKYHLNLAYTFSRIQITSVQDEFRGRLTEGTSDFSSVSVEFARDTRDNIWDPTRGTRNSVGMTVSGGPVLQGNIHYWKPSLSNSAHFQLFEVSGWPFVLTFSNRAAYITQYNATKEVPVFSRFYIGGQDTLRGYSPSGEAGYPSGAKIYDVFNVEFGFPLARERRKTIVKFVTFFDMGGAWDRVKDISGRIGSGTRDIKTNVGFGIRFTTPAFPIRLDWGYGFNHRPGERLYQINFGLGNLF